MSKEKLIFEFQNYLALSVVDKDDLVKLFIKAIDQTREETIRECENALPEQKEEQNLNSFEDGFGMNYENIAFNSCLDEIKQSLINLRSK